MSHKLYHGECQVLANAADTEVTKPSNPKDFIGQTKLPLHLVPDTMRVYATLSFAEGASKYGQFNWRVAGVRASIYKAALDRHLMKYWGGEWADPKTGVPHLSSALACIAIIIDARACGKLNDDRPPALDMTAEVEAAEAVCKGLWDIFKDHAPVQWTQSIIDGEKE